MNKAELKQKAHREFRNAHKAPWIEYHFTVKDLEEYVQQEIESLADFIDERYQEGDDTFSIYDWIEQFKQQEGE